MMAAAVAFKCIFSIKDSSLPIIYQNNNQKLLNILFDVCHELNIIIILLCPKKYTIYPKDLMYVLK